VYLTCKFDITTRCGNLRTLLYQLIYGIAALHEAGFIHRDIKRTSSSLHPA
jgi:serine/threonine protein kinase